MRLINTTAAWMLCAAFAMPLWAQEPEATAEASPEASEPQPDQSAATEEEAQGPALDLARQDLSGAGNVRFFAGDAPRLAAALATEPLRFGAVLLDPPREGAKGIGPILRSLGAPRAVYVSCDPATLARDVRGCVEAGYRVRAVQPVDMFPQTHHVEAAALLEP